MKELKNLFKNIFKSPVILVFVLICAFMLPNSINTMSIAFRSAIAVAIGIDKNTENKIVLQVAINISSASDSLAENNKVLSATGDTVGEALTSLNLMFGRSVKLGHTRFVMIGSKISAENVSVFIDRLIRTNKIRNTVQLVYCPNDIDEMFNMGIKLKSVTGIKLSDIVCHQQTNSTTSFSSNIDSFFKGYFSPSGISKINMISISEDYTQGVSTTYDVGSSSSSDGGSEAGAGGGESAEGGTSSSESVVSNKFISNRGKIAIYSSGVLQTVLDEELSSGVNWLSKDYIPQGLLVKVDNTGKLKNSIINFDILNKNVELETFFFKNIPIMSAKILVSLSIDEIISENGNKVPLSYDMIDEGVKNSIGRTIRNKISKVSTEAKKSKLDLFEINNIFYNSNYYEYTKLLQEGLKKEDFIENTQISVDIEINIR